MSETTSTSYCSVAFLKKYLLEVSRIKLHLPDTSANVA